MARDQRAVSIFRKNGGVWRHSNISIVEAHADAKCSMSPKYALGVLAMAVLMGFISFGPSVLPQEIVTSAWWKIGAPIIWLAAVILLWIQGVIWTREEKQNRVAQLRQEERLNGLEGAIAAQKIAITGTGAVTLPRLTVKATGRVSTLADKTEALAHDLLRFLKNKAPIPKQPPLRAPETGVKTWNDRWTDFWEVKHPLEQKIDAGYSAHFADAVSKLRHEIQESGINTWKLDELVDKKYHDSDTIREIATILLEISVRIRTNDLLKDATSD